MFCASVAAARGSPGCFANMCGDNGRPVPPEDPSMSASRPPGAAGRRGLPSARPSALCPGGAGSTAGGVRRRRRRSGLGGLAASALVVSMPGPRGAALEVRICSIVADRSTVVAWYPCRAASRAGTRCLPRGPAPWREGPAADGAARRFAPRAAGDAARLRGVVTGRVVLSELADLLRDARCCHAWPACPLVVAVAGRVSPAPSPWRCPICARSCRSARRTRRRPRSRRRCRR